jgi:CHAD domain-containing protein
MATSTDNAALEIEAKYDVDPTTTPPNPAGLPGVVSVEGPVTIDLDATYFDTADLALLDKGITLRRRRGGTDAGWHLKLPADRGRYELREPLGDQGGIPGRLAQVVRGVSREAPLVEVVTIATRRSTTSLRGEGGQLLAELCDDRVVAERRTASGQSRSTWREWELELSRDDPDLARQGAELLVRAGASPSRYASKLARALSSTPPERKPARYRHRHDATSKDVLAPFLEGQVHRLRQLDPLVRAGLPDSVHQMRVACRRMRAVLACFRAEFDRGPARTLRAELGWLVDKLGRERDLEVQRERVRAMVEAHDPATATEEGWIGDALASQLLVAHDLAHETLDSARYFGLLDALSDQDNWPGWTARASRPAVKELRRGLRREWHHLMAAARAAEKRREKEREEALHAVRKAARRLRYAAEACSAPVRGPGE